MQGKDLHIFIEIIHCFCNCCCSYCSCCCFCAVNVELQTQKKNGFFCLFVFIVLHLYCAVVACFFFLSFALKLRIVSLCVCFYITLPTIFQESCNCLAVVTKRAANKNAKSAMFCIFFFFCYFVALECIVYYSYDSKNML